MDQLSKYQGVNVYVKNLDDSIDDDRVRQEFAKFGTITSAKIMRDEKGNSKGFGFICFANPDEATRAVTDMNGNLLASKPLYVGLAQRKDVRRAQLEALHNQKLSQLRMAPQGVMPPIYPGGQPVFFQPGMPPQGPRMMYQQMVPRRFNPPTGNAPPAAGGAGVPPQGAGRQQGNGGFQQGIPNFVVPMGGGGQRQQQPRVPRGPRGPGGPNGGQPQGVPQGNGPNRPQAPPNAQARGFKYTSTARNQVPGAVPIPAGQSIPPQQQFPPQIVPGIQTTPEQLEAQMGSEESKQMIGEQLYSLIARIQPAAHAGKITGMLLESLDLRDLLSLLQNRQALDAKIAEALSVLEDVQQRTDVQTA